MEVKRRLSQLIGTPIIDELVWAPPIGRTGFMKSTSLLVIAWCVSNCCAARASDADDIYDNDRVLDVRLQISEDDWNLIRRQHPDMASFGQPDAPRAYTYVKSVATIDGAELGVVGVRKKGFVGSASSTRPSLKLDLREYEDLEYLGVSRLTLNNNQQDASQMHQILVYHVFRKAGIPAPRCSYATVTINDQSKGLYTNVEPIKKPFLKRHFGESDGDLYEGRRSDFRPGWTVTFEKKNNSGSGRDDLAALAAALEQDDTTLIDAVGELIDIEAFIRFWATECLVGHWDGYAENLNNFYMYKDPASSKFHFIPWGADSAFGDPNDFLEFEPPASVRAVGMLARRLYNHPETRARYRETLADLLANVWDEDELLTMVDKLERTIQANSPPIRGHVKMVAKIRNFIETRRGILEADLAKPATPWEFPLQDELLLGQGEPKGTFTATFTTEWAAGTMLNPFAGSRADFELQWDDKPPEFIVKGASAGPFPEAFRFGHPHVMIGGMTKNGHMIGASLIIEPESFTPGEHDINLFDVMGVIIDVNIFGGDFKPQFRGFLSGTLEFEKAEMEKGAGISGTLNAEIR